MKEITLSAAYYKAIQAEEGTVMALHTLLVDIQSHARDVWTEISLPIEVSKFGPNPDGEQVAIVLPVRAAAWKEGQKGYRVNRLTCGFGKDHSQALVGLFDALINPQVSPLIVPEALNSKEDEPAHEAHEEVIGLLVGNHEVPEALFRFGD